MANPNILFCLEVLLLHARAAGVVAGEASGPADSSRETTEAEAPDMRRLGKHHLSDKSVAAGGVVVTAIFVAVFAYIRVTKQEEGMALNVEFSLLLFSHKFLGIESWSELHG
ncbi:hypothetical protein V6N13_042138 [Hibiscus sabdariffa]|uniref:Uncharacterized protein n=1 Tax=Hibiscus sabdariffa TaxID=183260 RepID=A0ABR2DE53_9ROSI